VRGREAGIQPDRGDERLHGLARLRQPQLNQSHVEVRVGIRRVQRECPSQFAEGLVVAPLTRAGDPETDVRAGVVRLKAHRLRPGRRRFVRSAQAIERGTEIDACGDEQGLEADRFRQRRDRAIVLADADVRLAEIVECRVAPAGDTNGVLEEHDAGLPVR
jgi:hypothetical protein